MIIIAERINGTIPSVKNIILHRDTQSLLVLARGQAGAGASYIDLNVATGVGSPEDEIQAMKWAVETIQAEIGTPLCIDSITPVVMAAGLESRRGKPAMLNSTRADTKSLEAVIPLAREYNTALVALTMDESGIPRSVEDRLSAGEKIVKACSRHGFPIDKVFFDLLVIPISTDVKHGLITLTALMEFKKNSRVARRFWVFLTYPLACPGEAG